MEDGIGSAFPCLGEALRLCTRGGRVPQHVGFSPPQDGCSTRCTPTFKPLLRAFGRLLHDIDLLAREAVEVVDQLVDLAIRGIDLPP
jgi:hypothetical protein